MKDTGPIPLDAKAHSALLNLMLSTHHNMSHPVKKVEGTTTVSIEKVNQRKKKP